MRERPERGLPGLVQQVAEGQRRGRPQPHGHGVAVVADGVLGVGVPVEHRRDHQEVVAVGVAVDQRAERREQHHVGRAAGVLGQLGDALRGVGREPNGAARRAPVARHRRAVGPGQFQRLGHVGHHGPPVGDVVVDRVGGGPAGAARFRVQLRAAVGAGQVAEEHPPGAVVPRDVVGDQQQHVLVGSGAHQRDPQRRVLGQVEGRGEFALGQHLEAQLPGVLGELGQVVAGPARAQVGVHPGVRLAVLVGVVGGAQDAVPGGDRVDGLVQSGGVDDAGQPVGHADVQQRAAGIGGLHEPHPQLTVGEPVDGFRRRRVGAGGVRQPTFAQLASHQLETPVFEGGFSHAEIRFL